MSKKESALDIDRHLHVSEEGEQDEEHIMGRDSDKEDFMGRDSDKLSQFSSSSCPSPPESPSTAQTSTAWPQSCRHSMDNSSGVGSPCLSSLNPSVTCLNASFLSNSYKKLAKLNGSPLSASFLSTPYASFGPTEDLHGNRRKCNATEGTVNGINVLCGVGILSIPYALKEGGWLSLALFLLLAIMSFYTAIMLRRCLDSQPGLFTYPDIGQAAFGVTGRVIISIFLYSELFAYCVEYLILEGDTLSAVFPNASLNIYGVTLTGKQLFAILAALCVLPTVLLRDLSLLSYVSGAGVVATILVIMCVSWVRVVNVVGFHNGPLLRLSHFPVSIGIYGFCYSGHTLFPNIYTSLKDPSQFTKVMLISFALCTVSFGGMAVLGFTMYGEDTQSQITLNLPTNSIASSIAIWATIVNPFAKYALNITPVALSLEELVPSSGRSTPHYGFSVAIRTALVVATLGVAVLVPFFEYVMAFIGSFLCIMLSLIVPTSCFLKIAGKELSLPKKLFCLAIIILGSFCAIMGTYSSISGIIKSF